MPPVESNPWEFGWSALGTLGTLAAVAAALWLGWSSRKHTNQLMEADQRRQASLIRLTRPQPVHYETGPGEITINVDPTVINDSDEVVTDVVIETRIEIGTVTQFARPVHVLYLPAGGPQTISMKLGMPFPLPSDTYAVRQTLKFTDARDVRWKLDENYKLHRTHAGDGISPGPHAVEAWNEDNPVVVVMPPPPPGHDPDTGDDRVG